MPSLIPVDNVLGAFFLGVVLSSMLYGVTCLQVYSYFSRHSENDRPFLKYFVAALLVLESVQMALLVHGFYIAAVTNFGDFISDLKAPLSLQLQALMGILVAWAIQQFYAWRIYHLSMGQLYIPSFIMITSLAELAFGIAFFAQSTRKPDYQQASVQMSVVTPGLSLQVTCDLTITATMVYYLYTRCTRVAQTITAITTLALYSITSGALALVFSVSCLVTFVLFSRTLIYAPFFLTLVRIYVCAFMATLNSRDRIRTKLSSHSKNGIMINISMITRSFTSGPNRGGMDNIADVEDGITANPATPKDFARVGDDSG